MDPDSPRQQPESDSRFHFSNPDVNPHSLSWRLLNRFGFGPRPGDLSHVESVGAEAYLEEQLAFEQIGEDPQLLEQLDRLDTLELDAESARDREGEWKGDEYVIPLFRKLLQFPLPYRETTPGAVSRELQQARVLRAVYSRRQLFESMVEFWTDHFSIDQQKSACRWLKTLDDRQIRMHALGKFRDLLAASMHSPAMLIFLGNAESRKQDSSSSAAPNENFARELLELHTLGAQSRYSLQDVQEVARCLTGWSVQSHMLEFEPGTFVFRNEWHDDKPKRVLGYTIPGGLSERDGELLLNLLSRHPGTAEFICYKLCRRFVADHPPQDLVDRLTSVFLRTDGDIPSLIRTIVSSSQFIDPANMKFKRPFDFAVSAMRATKAKTDGVGILQHLEGLGQAPYRWPHPDGYPDLTDLWSRGLPQRWRFSIELLENRISGTSVDNSQLGKLTAHGDLHEICQCLARNLTGHDFPQNVIQLMSDWVTPGKSSEALPQWFALILSSPQFQWR